MQKSLSKFDDAGIRVAAISVDAPDVSRALCQQAGYTFPVLSDTTMEVIRGYDVAVEEEEIARPAEFLLDAEGVVRWRRLTDNYYVRARPEEVLEAAKGLVYR